LGARTDVLERSTDKCARGPAGFKLLSFPAGETHMCLMSYKTPFDFTYKVKVRTDKQSVSRSQIFEIFRRRNVCECFRGSRCDFAINLFEISMYRIRI
jgi:hypothetical protein